MNYKGTREYLEKVKLLGSVLGLDTIKELLKRLDNPEKNLKVVHIAGTNGKGSVMAFVQNILVEAGYKVGRYCSPAVFDERETIRINDEYISEEKSAEIITKIKKTCDEMVKDGFAHPTSFEIETAQALLYFYEQKCQITLIECGMGGETDATNVFDKVLCSIISVISLDHMQYLGESIKDIAYVKSGIIKQECPIVMSKQGIEVTEVIKEVCDKKSADLTITGDEKNVTIKEFKTYFDYEAFNKKTYHITLNAIGTYQIINAKTAIEVALVLEKAGFIVENFIEKGIEQTIWPGRMDVISKNPLIIMDGAHNPGAVLELRKTIDLYFTNYKITFIMGVLSDKDFSEEARIIGNMAENIITITPDNQRGLDSSCLAKILKKYNANVVAADSMEDGVAMALEAVVGGQSDMILAFGSLSYLKVFEKVVVNSISGRDDGLY